MPKKSEPFVIVRCRNAGVHAGQLISRKGTEVALSNSIRLWHWKGAASLSELAVYGTAAPSECRFGVPVKRTEVLDACEIIHATTAAEKNIRGVKSWRH